jgi:hypothetical protein
VAKSWASGEADRSCYDPACFGAVVTTRFKIGAVLAAAKVQGADLAFDAMLVTEVTRSVSAVVEKEVCDVETKLINTLYALEMWSRRRGRVFGISGRTETFLLI